MKKIFLYICMLCAALPMAAQTPDAQTVLDRTVEAFEKASGIDIRFRLEVAGDEQPGRIRLKDDKFLLEAGGVTTWFDGTTQWTYLPDADEVNISCPTPAELQAMNPYAWLSLYKQGYQAKLQNKADKNTIGVQLTATKRSQEIMYILLSLDARTYQPRKVTFKLWEGERMQIDIDSYRQGEQYADGMFRFDKKQYPTAEEIDLR